MEMTRYSTELRTRKYVKRYGLLSLWRNLSNKYVKTLLDTATKIELDALKTLTKKIEHLKQHKKFIENKTAECSINKCCRINYPTRKQRVNIQ